MSREKSSASAPHRVVIVGGGFGGLFAARVLKRAPVEVTLINRDNYHLFQPLLYQVATGILSEGEIAPAIRDILRRQRNARVMLSRVDDFDLERGAVVATRPDGAPIEVLFDSLIVAAGAGQSFFGHDEYSRWAPGMKTISDALEIRGRLFGAFEMAALIDDPDLRAQWLTFVVVGGGPTGVEIAGQIAELSRQELRGDFRRFDPADARVLLFDGGEEILASFGNRLSGKGRHELERLGVEVHTETMVTALDAYGVTVKAADGTPTTIPARTKIWAAGVQASPLAERLARAAGAETDQAGRIAVEPDCSLAGHPNVFAVGDMMALNGLPGVSEVAMQSGIHASMTIRARLAGRETKRFVYRDLGSMAAISRYRAIASIGPLRLSGFIGWLAWLLVHLTFLTGFKNRVATLLHWTSTLVTRRRSEKTITQLDTIGRVAIEQAGGEDFLAEFTEEVRDGDPRPEATGEAPAGTEPSVADRIDTPTRRKV